MAGRRRCTIHRNTPVPPCTTRPDPTRPSPRPGAARVGWKRDGSFTVNPSQRELEHESCGSLLLARSRNTISMCDLTASEVRAPLTRGLAFF